jgi:hypothetical protein
MIEELYAFPFPTTTGLALESLANLKQEFIRTTDFFCHSK